MVESLSSLLRREALSTETYRERAKDLQRTFRDGQSKGKFTGLHKVYQPLKEDGEKLPGENKEVSATVKSEMAWFKDFFVKACNAMTRRERTNVTANADLKVLGNTFIGLPAIALVNLETKLKDLKKVLITIPVLDDVKKWTISNKIEGIFSSDPEWVYKSIVTYLNHVKHPGDEHHQPQVEVFKGTENVGKYTTVPFSGAIPVSAKAEILKNVDEAISATISAREGANRQALTDVKDDFRSLFDSILDPMTRIMS